MVLEAKSLIFCPTTQISHACRAGKPSLLNNWAMLSGDIISDSGEIKGVALWMIGWAFFWFALGAI